MEKLLIKQEQFFIILQGNKNNQPIYNISSIPSDFEVEKEKCFRPTRAFDGPSSCKKLIIVTMALQGTTEKCLLEHVGEAALCPDPFSDPSTSPRGNILLHVSTGASLPQREASPQSLEFSKLHTFKVENLSLLH